MRKKSLLWGLLVCVVAGGIAAVVGLVQFKGDAVPAGREIFIRSTADYEQLTDSLLPSISRRWAFETYARRLNLTQTFKPGHYTLKPGMSVVQIARMLKLGQQTPVQITINNVRTPAQLAQKLARQIEADSASILEVFRSEELTAEVGFDPVTLFSMFIPNTYEFYWTVTPADLVRRMKREYDRFWTSNRESRRERLGLSRLEVMTLASIVDEETNKKDEMSRIAGVYLNRLRIGMPLQADPTVKYALQDFGLKRILFKHLKTQSPYNTYVNKGLPPSPISMPDIAAIDAVLGAEQHNYLYFCARPTLDGYHSFARTLSEHNANARAYSAELNRRKIK